MRRFIDELHGYNTQFFNADDGGGEGGGSGGNEDGSEDDKGDKGAGDEGADKRTVTMTQAELDALIGREKARAKKPYSDYDDVKTKLSDYEKAEDERKKAAMSEKERLEAEKSEALQKAQDADDARTKALDSANQRIIRSEFRLLAKESGVRADALDDAYVLADKSAINVDDDGNVVGIAEVIDALIKAKPFLAEPAKKEPRNIGGGHNPDDKPEKTKEQLLTAAAEKARKTGRIEDRMAYDDLKQELSN